MLDQNQSILNQEISKPVRVIILVVLLGLATIVGYTLGQMPTPKVATTKVTTSAKVEPKLSTTNQVTDTTPTKTTTPATTVTPTPTDETAGWTTNTNSNYGYSFKAPSTWTVNSVQSTNTDSTVVSIDSTKDSSVTGQISLTIYSVKQGSAIPELPTDDCTAQTPTTISFGDKKVDKTVYTCENGDTKVVYGTYSSSGNYNYSATAIQTGDDGAIATADKILSTFKLTN